MKQGLHEGHVWIEQNILHSTQAVLRRARDFWVLHDLPRFLMPRLVAATLLLLLFYVPAVASSNVQNLFSNAPEIHGYQLGDFDGDGVTDVFRIVGDQWQYAPGGVGGWRDLATDSTPLGDLRFGDFNGDGVTDVFRSVPAGGTNQWQVSFGGRTAWVDRVADPRPLGDLRFGDFNGDGRTDVFSVNAGGQWVFSPGGIEGWRNLAVEPATALGDLRFGDFNGDGRTDVFRAVWTGTTYQWQYSTGGQSAWQNLATDPTPLGDLRFADLDGNGFTDVFRIDGNQWQYSPGARQAWVNLAVDSTPLGELRFGDFDGDGISDVFHVSGGQLRYSSGGVRAWAALVPGSKGIYDLRFGDFNNDGITDVFRAVWTGSTYQWQYSPGGVGAWENLATDSTPLELLRFGDFNGDGYTDVFRLIASGGTNQWQYSPRGRDPWQNLATDPALLTELRFGDFNGDGRTDVFSAVRQTDGSGNYTGYQWRYASAATGAWQNLASDSTPFSQLRFDHFDADATTDVFSLERIGTMYSDATYRWRYSAGGAGGWQSLATDPRNLTGLRFADLDGNGVTDVFGVVRQADTYQWRYARDARDPWQNLVTDPTPPSDLRFGDFNGDGRDDVFGIGPDGRWRYSPGGAGAWILLGPPADATPTPTTTLTPTLTPTPTGTPGPTATPTPTGQPPAQPSCPNILSNSSFEQNTAWIFGNSPIPGKYTSIQARSGTRSVQLGNPPDSGFADQESYSSIRQAVTIPRHATSVQLRWWHFSRSEEGTNPNPSSSQDRQEVILLTPQGKTLKILARVLRNDNAWQQSVLDLTEFAGQSFHLYFNVYNDGNGARTWMYLDDVELAVCAHQGQPPGHQPPGHQPPGAKPPSYHPPYKGPPAGYRPPSGYQPKPYKRPPVHRPPVTYPTEEPTPTTQPEPEIQEAFVVTVITGDTILVRIDGVEHTVRYLGVDAPDLNQEFGEEAAGLNDFLVAGNIVYLERDESNTDRFGRLLRYVFLDDGTFVNLELVRMGLARATGAGADTRYLADLLQAEIDAREAGVGIWSDPDNDFEPNDLNGNGLNGNDLNGNDLNGNDLNGNDLGFVEPENDALAPSALETDSMEATPTPGPIPPSQERENDNGPDTTSEVQEPVPGFAPADPALSLEPEAVAPGEMIGENGAENEIDVQTPPELDSEAEITPEPEALPPISDAPATANRTDLDEDLQLAPSECLELVNNGAFDVPDTGWNLLGDEIPPRYVTEPVFNDSRYSLQLGIAPDVSGDIENNGWENRAGISAIDQVIRLPENADSILLTFRYWPRYTGEPGPGDLQYVDIYNGLTGQFAGRVLSEQRNAETWAPVNYDLTQLAGQPIRLVFAVNNDGEGGVMSMYIDQVSIWACNLNRTEENSEATSPTPDATPTTELVPSSSGTNRQTNLFSDDLSDWIDRLGAALTMGGILGALALISIVAIGVRGAKRN